jgi:N-formylglutamate amidohydrolase
MSWAGRHEPSFVIEQPTGPETAVLVEVPHAGVHVDALSLATMIASLRSAGRDADLFVDDIFAGSPGLGATFLAARTSRFVVDLNRARDAFDALAVEGGQAQELPRGVVWRTTTEGERIVDAPLPRAELARRLREVYDPYHTAIAAIVAEKRARFGYAVLLCAHSMPSTGRRGHVDLGRGRADIVPGTRGRSSADGRLIDRVDAAAARAGFSIKHDDPYKGGFSTGHYGQPASGVHAIQIEMARRLYMDENRLVPSPDGMARVRAFAEDLVRALGEPLD